MSIDHNYLIISISLMSKICEEMRKTFGFVKSGNNNGKEGGFHDQCIILAVMINKKQVYEKLQTVMDPELNISIVDLGLIYEVRVKKKGDTKQIMIEMTLTTPGCPLAPVIDRMVKEAVAEIEGVEKEDVEVELIWDPPWTQDMMSEEGKLELGML